MELPRRKQELVIAANDLDEELVVSSLLAFLEAITLRHPDVKCDWSTRRRNLKAKFGTSDLRAIVDGALVDPKNNNVQALIEAKKDKSKSQEAKELFLVVGTFGEEYLDYISGRTTKLASKDFLALERFGAWKISDAEDLEMFAGIALAIAIQGSK
ncbi:hypothetical protein N7449_001264 [Penicillium cf. viridicatum]|uniref:Uncharacterized protein n=1 Tax=Penicillium cf. viridicatum TaxID=2972119 RepID=A0A9W9N6I1_9EURO|nr:hypothetical protein N7449_001264 [Penicillium cf. viridicatum]